MEKIFTKKAKRMDREVLKKKGGEKQCIRDS